MPAQAQSRRPALPRRGHPHRIAACAAPKSTQSGGNHSPVLDETPCSIRECRVLIRWVENGAESLLESENRAQWRPATSTVRTVARPQPEDAQRAEPFFVGRAGSRAGSGACGGRRGRLRRSRGRGICPRSGWTRLRPVVPERQVLESGVRDYDLCPVRRSDQRRHAAQSSRCMFSRWAARSGRHEQAGRDDERRGHRREPGSPGGESGACDEQKRRQCNDQVLVTE